MVFLVTERDGKASEFDLSKDQLKRAKKKIFARSYHKTGDDRWWWTTQPRQITFNRESDESGSDDEVS